MSLQESALLVSRPRKALFIETSDLSVESHLDGLLSHLAKRSFEVCVASSDSGRLKRVAARNQVRSVAVGMERNPSVWGDIRSLLALVRVVRRERPDIVIYGTPKAALLSAVASWVCRVPRRIHVLHGLRVETLGGIKRQVYLFLDRLIERLSTATVAVGHGLAARAVEIGSLRHRPRVLGHGSAQGIDLTKFAPAGRPSSDLGAFVVGFVGRITADKGVDSLCQAFNVVGSRVPAAELHLVGAPEGIDTLHPETQAALDRHPAIRALGETSDVPAALEKLDVLCLPTRREGLPTILMEAAAMGIPIVATRATGVEDVVDDESAWLVPIDDAAALASALLSVYEQAAEAEQRARRAMSQVRARFHRDQVWARWYEFVEGELAN